MWQLGCVHGDAMDCVRFAHEAKRIFHGLRRLPLLRIARRAAARAQLMPLVESGQMRPLMDKTFELKDALEAQTYMSSGAHAGKLLLSCA